MRKKVAVVVSHPIQHFCPLYAALTTAARIELRVFFASTAGATPYFDAHFAQTISWQKDLLHGFAYEFLPGAQPEIRYGESIDNGSIASRLGQFNPDAVIIYGIWHRISRRALWWSKRHKKACLLISDGELKQRRTIWTRLRKRITLPAILSQLDGFLTVGDANEAYYRHYGVPTAKLFRCPFPVDEKRFVDAARERELSSAAIRTSLGLSDRHVIGMSVGKLTERKAVADVVCAIGSLLETGRVNEKRFHFLIAGDGPERGRLEQLTRTRASKAISIIGYKSADELPAYYQSVDFLVHPSASDPHPLAVSEAVVSGLPVLVSDIIGSIGPSDDAQPGTNAVVFPQGNIAALAEGLHLLATNESVRAKLANGSTRVAVNRTLAASVSSLISAVGKVTGC
jgi:glycosyltransferase involved in cell wall biosynthesis